MKKIAILLIIFLFISVIFLSGCNNKNNTSNQLNPDEYGIIGTWIGESHTFRFFSDKTFTFVASIGLGASGSGTWEIIDDNLSLTVISSGESVIDVYDYSFSNNGKELTLTDEKGSIFLTKQ